jgi:hypothetical protein
VLVLAVLVGASSASAGDHQPKPPHHPKPPPPPTSPNMLRGGSFEHPRVRPGSSHPFASIRGWRLAYGPDFELQNRLLGAAARGEQYAELDSDASTGIFQLVHTHADRTYRLEFCASARPGTPPAENVLIVKWQRRLLARIVLDGGDKSQIEWHDYKFKVQAAGSRTRLQFNDRGISDSVGTLLDAVRLHPEKARVKEGCAAPKPRSADS